MPPEIIELEHIRLRRPTVADAEAIFEYGSDPEVARYADWPVRTTIEPLIDSLRQRAARWESGEEFSWVITLPATDVAIGGVSCRVVRHTAEVGFLINRRYWSRGFATAASRAAVEWAMSNPAIWRVWATCDTENLASARVLEKCGLSREGTLRRAAIRPNLSPVPRDAYLYARVRADDHPMRAALTSEPTNPSASDCWTCASNTGVRRVSPGVPIYEGVHWLVEHAYPVGLLGWVVIALRRHAAALHELTAEEYRELAQIQALLIPVLKARFRCEKEYVACFAEAEHFQHVHFHVVPVPADLPPSVRGARSLALLAVTDTDAVPRADVQAVCLALRDSMHGAAGLLGVAR